MQNTPINGSSINIDLREEAIIDNKVMETFSPLYSPFVEKIHVNLLSHFISKNDIPTALKVAQSLKSLSDSKVFEIIFHQMYSIYMCQEQYNYALELMNILHHFVPSQGIYSALLKNAKTREESL